MEQIDPTAYWLSRRHDPGDEVVVWPEEADVVVVGAGFSGLSTVRSLQESMPNPRIVLIERQRVAAGASGRNAGMLVPFVGAPWLLPGALPEADAAWALDEVARRFGQLGSELSILHAGLGEADFYVGSPHRTLVPVLRWLGDRFRSSGMEVERLDGTALAERTGECGVGALRVDAWRIDPLRLSRSLADRAVGRGVELIEGANVSAVVDRGNHVDVLVDDRTIQTHRAVVSVGAWGPSSRLTRRPGKVTQTFMVASEPLDDATVDRLGGERALVVGLRRGMPYRRVVDGRLLFGGLDWRVPRRANLRPDVDHPGDEAIGTLRRLAQTSLPWLRPLPELTVAWGGPIESRGLHELPLIDWRPGSSRIVEVTGMAGSGVFWGLQVGDMVRGMLADEVDRNADAERLRRCLAATRVPVGGVVRAGWEMLAGAAA